MLLKGWYGMDRPPYLAQVDSIMYVNLMKLSKAGITIATGTDAGNIGTMHASSYFKELQSMQKAGLSNWDLLVYSSLEAARGFGIDDQLGSVTVGKKADLVLLNQSPLDNLQHFKDIALVVKSGIPLEPQTILQESPEQIVQRQVNAYNARDIDAFLATYAENVKIYNESGQLIMEGHEQMRAGYADMFKTVTNLYCEIENRMVINNKVIDKEKVRYNDSYIEAVAVYEVKKGKITKVNFIE